VDAGLLVPFLVPNEEGQSHKETLQRLVPIKKFSPTLCHSEH
jgi:hypothetical protein